MAAGELLLPETCMICGGKLLMNEKYLCLLCQANLPLTYFWNQNRNPMADRFNEGIQTALDQGWIRGPERYAYACSLFYYDDEDKYRHITHHIKYHGDIPAGVEFGRMLGMKIAGCQYLGDIDMIIPVPLHWRRKWKRGYNQAAAVARGVAELLDVTLNETVLIRSRYTHTQTKVDVSQKGANVMGAFEVQLKNHQTVMKARHILLIDDIFTTGATLLACFCALRSVFPPSVRISVATLGFVGGA